jgi:hypothetical protein
MGTLRRYGWQIYLAGCVVSWPLFLYFETYNLSLAGLNWSLHACAALWPTLLWPVAWPVAFLGLFAIAVAKWLHG